MCTTEGSEALIRSLSQARVASASQRRDESEDPKADVLIEDRWMR
jgi:hypothetical protein